MFLLVHAWRDDPAVATMTAKIESLLQAEPGQWFGFGGPNENNGINDDSNGTHGTNGSTNGHPAGHLNGGTESTNGHSKTEDVEVVLKHATTEEQLVVTVQEDCTLLDVRRAAMALLGEKKLSEVKLVKRGKSGFTGLPDEEGLKGRKELFALGREFGSAATAGAPVQAASGAHAQTQASPGALLMQESATLLVAVYIDRSLGIKSEVTVPRLTTVLQLKERIAADDPTGSTRPEQFSLKVPDASGPLPDIAVLTNEHTELELCLL